MPRSAVKQEVQALQAAPASVISNSLSITGDLHSAGHVHIDGSLKGDLEADSIVVGKKGSIEGNITADSIEVRGFVSGNITARVVEFSTTAHVIGDTIHEDLRVEKGACLDGSFRKHAPAAPAQPAPAKPATE